MHQRLFEITHLLTQRGSVTAGELAQRFGVSRRTIYRDVDALSSAGIPVYAEKGKGGGIRILPDFVLDKTLFSRQEQQQLVAHFEGLAGLGTPDTQPVLDKLAALFGRGGSWLEVDFAPWDGGDDARELFRSLREAILQRHTVTFSYSGAEGDSCQGARRRTVEPLRLVFRGQGWYLSAWCRLRGDYRFFKLNRMQDVAFTSEEFPPREPPQRSVTVPTPQSILAVMKISPRAAFRARDEFPPGDLEQLPDGGFIARGSYPAGNWLLGYLLSYGPDLELISPEPLRRELAGMARGVFDIYNV